MTPLDAIVIARAEEQVRTIRLDEPTKHDRWQIRGVEGRAPTAKRTRCLAGDCAGKVKAHGYCARHLERIRRGFPVDGYCVLTKAEVRRMSGGLRFGYSPRSRALAKRFA